ncbi:MAG: PEP-CTERM sorting domain-containing protein, partial [Microcystis sp.]
ILKEVLYVTDFATNNIVRVNPDGTTEIFSNISTLSPNSRIIPNSRFITYGSKGIAYFTISNDNPHPPIPEPSTVLSLLALGTLGAASTLKRQLKPSKSTEKETTK